MGQTQGPFLWCHVATLVTQGGKVLGLSMRQMWVPILALPFPRCVDLCKLLHKGVTSGKYLTEVNGCWFLLRVKVLKSGASPLYILISDLHKRWLLFV